MRRALDKVVSGIYLVSQRKLAQLDEPLQLHIQHANANGVDLTHAVNREYYDNWRHLWPYRKQRLSHEIHHFQQGGVISVAALNLKDCVSAVKFFARFMVCFMFGIMAARGSVLPLMAPDSPLRPGLDIGNPNFQ
jgi:hypothetical protein